MLEQAAKLMIHTTSFRGRRKSCGIKSLMASEISDCRMIRVVLCRIEKVLLDIVNSITSTWCYMRCILYSDIGTKASFKNVIIIGTITLAITISFRTVLMEPASLWVTIIMKMYRQRAIISELNPTYIKVSFTIKFEMCTNVSDMER